MKRLVCATLLGASLPLAAADDLVQVQSSFNAVPELPADRNIAIGNATVAVTAGTTTSGSATPGVATPGVATPGVTDTGAFPSPRRIEAGSFDPTLTTPDFSATGVTPAPAFNAGSGTGTLARTVVGGGGVATGGNTVDEVSRITSAMSAAPAAVSVNATILDFPAVTGAAPIVLRAGSNGWSCFPDNPATPGNDPVCLDKQFLAWLDALNNRRSPNVTGTGIAYMLQGGSVASISDPFSATPVNGQNWLTLPPHIRVISPQLWDRTVYSAGVDASFAAPWIMFADTPYEHVIIPLPITVPVQAPVTAPQ